MQKIANEMNLPETAFFVPTAGVNEDHDTGSSHTILMPYWSKQLRRHKLVGRQVSARGRTFCCELAGDRVKIAGNVAGIMTDGLISAFSYICDSPECDRRLGTGDNSSLITRNRF